MGQVRQDRQLAFATGKSYTTPASVIISEEPAGPHTSLHDLVSRAHDSASSYELTGLPRPQSAYQSYHVPSRMATQASPFASAPAHIGPGGEAENFPQSYAMQKEVASVLHASPASPTPVISSRLASEPLQAASSYSALGTSISLPQMHGRSIQGRSAQLGMVAEPKSQPTLHGSQASERLPSSKALEGYSGMEPQQSFTADWDLRSSSDPPTPPQTHEGMLRTRPNSILSSIRGSRACRFWPTGTRYVITKILFLSTIPRPLGLHQDRGWYLVSFLDHSWRLGMHDLIIIDQVILIASECQGLTVSWGCAGESSAILASSGETALRRALMRQASWATPTSR